MDGWEYVQKAMMMEMGIRATQPPHPPHPTQKKTGGGGGDE